jgi:PAS domain S-box-containing protein
MRFRSIIFSLTFLILLSITVGGILYYHTLVAEVRTHIVDDAVGDINDIAGRIATSLSEYQRIAAALAGLRELRAALTMENADTIRHANMILDLFQSTVDADVCYLINRTGNTIASSNRNTSESFVGKNFAFRPYFQKAFSGTPAIYPALGVVTNKRGLYFSYPVYGGNRRHPEGVLVIKKSTDSIEKEIKLRYPGIVTFTDSYGIVFISSKQEWLYHSLWNIPEDVLSEIIAKQQFGQGPIEWLGMVKKEHDDVIDDKRVHYIIKQKDIYNLPGWKVVYLLDSRILLREISSRVFSKFDSSLVVFCIVVSLTGLFLYRKADQEITKRKLIDEDQKQSLSLLEATLESTADGILVVDKAGKIEKFNAHFAEIWRLPDDILSSKDESLVLKFVLDQLIDPQGFLTRVKDLYAHPEEESFDVLDFKDGRVLERYSRPQRIGENIVGRVWSFRDITARRLANESLRKSEERLRLAELASKSGNWELHLNSQIIISSDGAAKLYGTDKDKFDYDVIKRIPLPEYRPLLDAALYKLITGTGPYDVEFKIRTVDTGELRDIHSIATFDKEKRILFGIIQDITDRKRAEKALRESEERYRDLADSLPITVFEFDLEGRFTYINNAALEYFGYTRQDVDAGLNVIQMIALEDRLRAQSSIARRISGGPQEYAEYLGLRKDGITFPIIMNTSTILRDNKVIGLRGIMTDLTVRKQLEQEHSKTEKLESIGTLAGGIAHDFNNLLQGVFGYISLSKLKIDDRDKSIAALEQAEKALHMSVKLTNQLLTFSKGGKPVKKAINIAALIENAAKFALSGSRTDCRVVADDNLSQVDADEGQISQVIQNIVLNADQAMPDGGRVEIMARNVHAQDSNLPQGLQQRNYVEITIKDNGMGIPENYLGRIFDPYFTTKEKGSGLGLATSYSIIKNHYGVIDVKSEVGKGTTFFIYLPAISAIKAEVQNKPAVAATAGRAGRVLVMDDDQVIRDVAGALIGELGHRVAFAAHGKEAIEKYEEAKRSGDAFDVIILDLTVRGGVGGAETVKKILEIDPDVKAIASSGYSGDVGIAGYQEQGFKAFLKKPYNVDDLRDLLNRMLNSQPL